jgi:phosphopantetheinyl transferase (holo-ACP synthase)
MTGTGNDIVSLNAINVARTNQYKFYSKILSDSENPLYNEFGLAGVPFENFVWLLWSIKESAYKFLQRNDPALVFTPVKFVVEKLQFPSIFAVKNFGTQMEGTGFEGYPSINGVITFGSYTLHSRSLLYHELIATVVNLEDNFENICWGIKLINDPGAENQSKEVRLLLIERLKDLYDDFNFSIDKNPYGCPILLKGSEETSIPVSLSHHENFVGYSLEINQ